MQPFILIRKDRSILCYICYFCIYSADLIFDVHVKTVKAALNDNERQTSLSTKKFLLTLFCHTH